MKTLSCVFAALLGAATLLSATVEVYKINPVHSSVTFKVRHFFTPVAGSFSDFSGTITLDRDDMTKSRIEGEIRAMSVDTNNDDRDEHVRGEDFLKTSDNPLMSFKSTKWEMVSDSEYEVTGDLKMAGKTVPVTFEFEVLGFNEGRRGEYLGGFEAETEIKRSDWGITYGQPAVGDDVEIEITVQAVRQDEA